MDWNLLSYVPMVFLGVLFVVLLWGVNQMWKVNNKFISIILLALAVAVGIAFYAIYGKKLFG